MKKKKMYNEQERAYFYVLKVELVVKGRGTEGPKSALAAQNKIEKKKCRRFLLLLSCDFTLQFLFFLCLLH